MHISLAIVWSFDDHKHFWHENSACQSAQYATIGPAHPRRLPHLFIFALIYFYFICRRKSRLSPAVPQPRRDATSTVNRKPCGIVAILSRMRVSTCTRRSYARRSKYGNAFTRNVFTGISRNTKSARGLPNGLQTSLIVLDGGEKPSPPQCIFRTHIYIYIYILWSVANARVFEKGEIYLKATSLLN